MVSTRRSNRIAANATAAKAAKASAPPAPAAPKRTQPKRKTTTTKKRAAPKKTTPATLKKRRTGLSTSVSTVAPLGVVDPASKIAGQIHVLEDDHGHTDPEPCDVMLVLCDPAKNTDKFYVLQLIERTDGSYVVYSRWGRTGSVGQALEKDFDDLEGALKEFNKLFEDKTGLTWENRAEPTVGTKYRFVQQNFTEKQNGYSSATWQYWVDDGVDGKPTGWYDYDSEGSMQAERLFLEFSLNANLNKRQIASGVWTYEVNLTQMTQTNVTHANRTSRRIRRVLAQTLGKGGAKRKASPTQTQTSAIIPPTPVSSNTVITHAGSGPPVVTPVLPSTPITPKQQAKKAAAKAASPVKSTTASTPTKKKGCPPVDKDVDEKGHNASNFSVVQNAEGVWYDVMLNQCNITGGNNNNKYYKIQMLKHNTTGMYYVWLKWGRVGESSTGRDMKGSFGSEDAALPTFLKKYKDKTANAFDAEEFKAKKGKYIPLEIDHDAEVSDDYKTSPTETKNIEYLPSELDPKTKDLIEVLFSDAMRDETLCNYNLDPSRLPLGVPSEQQIQIGVGILSQIEDKLNGSRVADSYAELSSQFYTAFPFSTGRSRPPVINNKQLLQERFDMCNVLLDMVSTNETIRKIKQEESTTEKVPCPADSHYKSLNADLTVLDKKSAEYKKILTYFNKTKSRGQLLDVWQCDRAGEAERHQKFDDLDHRRLLWHGTNIAVVAPILTTGLRIMPHSGGRVGAGIYLASMQEKSASYTSGYGSKFACMFLCEAALGKMHEVTADGQHAWSLKKAPKGYDSVHAVGQIRPKKWNDVELDARKVQIAQDTREQSGVDSSFYHDEFLVYDESQIRLRYVLTVKL